MKLGSAIIKTCRSMPTPAYSATKGELAFHGGIGAAARSSTMSKEAVANLGKNTCCEAKVDGIPRQLDEFASQNARAWRNTDVADFVERL
jgi:hypothetical protein